MIVTKPNQRVVVSERTLPTKESGKVYGLFFVEDLEKASRELSEVPFKLYIYLSTQKPKNKLAFSPQHLHETWGCSISCIKGAFDELVLRGYLRRSEGITYVFNAEGDPEERRYFDTDEGERLCLTKWELQKAIKPRTKKELEETWAEGGRN